jgi:hypothetical protein
MKKNLTVWVMLITAGLMLQACGPAATQEPPTLTIEPSATPTNTTAPTPTETPTPLPPTEPPIDMLAWLFAYPFKDAPEEFQEAVYTNQVDPLIDVGDLPEGFIMTESMGGVAYLPEGEAFNARTEYLFPIDDEVSPENSVTVSLLAYANADVRAYHFEVLVRTRQAHLQNIGAVDVLFFYDQSSIGHTWISGPFLVLVGSAPPADGSQNAWLDIFSEFMVDLYPPGTN